MIQSCIDALPISVWISTEFVALPHAQQTSVYTIHGFCSQVLASHNIAIGVPPISPLKPTNQRTLYALPKTSSVFMCCPAP